MSRSTTSESSGDLRNSFNFLSINDQKQTLNYDYINIPKPYKPASTATSNPLAQLQQIINNKKQMTLFDDFLKQSQTQNLLDSQIKSQHDTQILNNNIITQSDFKFPPFMYWQLSAYGIPLQYQQQQEIIQQTFNQPNLYQTPPQFNQNNYIGTLTKDERKQKVLKYQEKKKSRKQKEVKYPGRKEQADNRQRDKGRFVKNENRVKFDFFDKQKYLKCLEKDVNKIKTIENQSWPHLQASNQNLEEEEIQQNLFSNINFTK